MSDESWGQHLGTALFISATLLQRELIEMLVPLQQLSVDDLYHSVSIEFNNFSEI